MRRHFEIVIFWDAKCLYKAPPFNDPTHHMFERITYLSKNKCLRCFCFFLNFGNSFSIKIENLTQLYKTFFKMFNIVVLQVLLLIILKNKHHHPMLLVMHSHSHDRGAPHEGDLASYHQSITLLVNHFVYRSIIIIQLGTTLWEKGWWSPTPLADGGDITRPYPNPAQCTQTLPTPLSSSTSLPDVPWRGCLEKGGSWGEGLDNRARGNNLSLLNQIEMGAYHPPSHSKVCGKLWWEGGRAGVGSGWTPRAPSPTCTACSVLNLPLAEPGQ